MQGKGHLTIVAGPSGSGKSTLIKKLLSEVPSLSFPTSVTTREPRAGEVDGDHYFFISRDDFRAKIEKGEFLEWAAVYGKYYGTLKSTVRKALESGQKLLKDIDIQGARSLMGLVDRSLLTTIFVAPPSVDELKRRLRERDSETPETLQNRLAEAEVEMAGMDQFDLVIVNDDLDQSYQKFKEAVVQ